MIRNRLLEFSELYARQLKIKSISLNRAMEQQFRFSLLLNARDEVRRALHVERHDDHTAQQAPEKRCHPLRAILSLKQHTVALTDAASFEFAGEPKCRCRNVGV